GHGAPFIPALRYSITSSARANSVGGISRPSCQAQNPVGPRSLAGFCFGAEFAAITRPGGQQHRTLDHDTSSLIGGREPLEVYRPKIPAEVFLRPGPNGQSERRLRTFV